MREYATEERLTFEQWDDRISAEQT
jgi:hypothetical protein